MDGAARQRRYVDCFGAPSLAGRILWRGILLNILNPKLPLFFVACLPQFLPVDGASPAQMLELGLGFSVMTLAVILLYAGLSVGGRHAILGSERLMRWPRRTFAASFAGLGLKLAIERQA